MPEPSVIHFLEVQRNIFLSCESIDVIERQKKTRRDISRLLWEYRNIMGVVDAFFGHEKNCVGITDQELAWLE